MINPSLQRSFIPLDWAVVSPCTGSAFPACKCYRADLNLQVFPGEKSLKDQSCKISLLKGILVVPGRWGCACWGSEAAGLAWVSLSCCKGWGRVRCSSARSCVWIICVLPPHLTSFPRRTPSPSQPDNWDTAPRSQGQGWPFPATHHQQLSLLLLHQITLPGGNSFYPSSLPPLCAVTLLLATPGANISIIFCFFVETRFPCPWPASAAPLNPPGCWTPGECTWDKQTGKRCASWPCWGHTQCFDAFIEVAGGGYCSYSTWRAGKAE